MRYSTAHTTLAVGQSIAGRYHVDEVFAVGGMSTLYVATDALLARPVVMKVVSDQMLDEPGGVARFLREARAAAQLRTPRVPQVFDAGVTKSGHPYLVMERLEGKDLTHVIAEASPVPIEVAIDYIIQACDALAEVHARGIVHRDIKPANLFVTTTADGAPFVKLLDFGVSKMLAPNARDVALTQPGETVGTPEYMSPEQLERPKSVDARADVWSLGVVLFELLTGTALFLGDTIADVIDELLTKPIPRISHARPDAGPELDEVVARCLARDPSLRFADAGELALALAPFGRRDAVEKSGRVERAIARARNTEPDALTFARNAGLASVAEADRNVLRLFAGDAGPARDEHARDGHAHDGHARDGSVPTLPRVDLRDEERAVPARSGVGRLAVIVAAFVAGIALATLFALHARQANEAAPVSRSFAALSRPSAPQASAVDVANVAIDESIGGEDTDVDQDDHVLADAIGIADSDGSRMNRQRPALPMSASASPRAARSSRTPHGVAHAHKARLVLDAMPAAGTELRSDGRPLTLGPSTAVEIEPGVHRITAVSSGLTVWASRIDASDGAVVHVHIPSAYARAYEER